MGPLMPTVVSAKGDSREGEFAQSASESRDGEMFLDRMLVERGPHSILYISFGSIWQPLEPPMFWAFLEVVVEKKIPFILTDLGNHPPLPAHLPSAVSDYGWALCENGSPGNLSCRIP
ncbi:hypothetical protein DFH07DRAFT_49089 [Mycena maculata]|uniref:Uncharacterized protein n=1 Tax=Mycena maculata TaxID=230809 RepID=A0AAD7IFK0_9AGAR|nr:hypothetical protein DFH07DRAFT_49089 [Mycena maculata]